MQDWRAGDQFEIQCDESGVTLVLVSTTTAEPQTRLAWEEINAVFAYKRDCFSVDQIRLILGDERNWVEVTEDDIGFKVLIRELPRRIPGFPSVDDWWDRVAQPPFETQWTELYRHQGLPVK